MTEFDKPKANIHFISRGLLVQGDNIILCRMVGSKWYFLPGGHIENGETAKQTLLRELEEEIKAADYKIGDFLGVCENTFELSENVLQQEVNMVFAVEVPQDLVVDTKEGHIEFVVVPKSELLEYKILPAGVKDGVAEWLNSGKVFHK
jgi:ADP-ribose pyrophosphatase YjhB (NUDIX family)